MVLPSGAWALALIVLAVFGLSLAVGVATYAVVPVKRALAITLWASCEFVSNEDCYVSGDFRLFRSN